MVRAEGWHSVCAPGEKSPCGDTDAIEREWGGGNVAAAFLHLAYPCSGLVISLWRAWPPYWKMEQSPQREDAN